MVVRAGGGSGRGRGARGAAAACLLASLALLATACSRGPTTTTSASSTDAGTSSSAPASGAGTSSAAAGLDTVLTRALTEEHAAKATYDNVLAALGNVAPFTQVSAAESRHIAELETVARAHGVDVTAVTASGSPSPTTLAEACRMGVAAEQADITLYDDLIPQVAAYPDVATVFRNLRAASQDSHLPAFQRCA